MWFALFENFMKFVKLEFIVNIELFKSYKCVWDSAVF